MNYFRTFILKFCTATLSFIGLMDLGPYQIGLPMGCGFMFVVNSGSYVSFISSRQNMIPSLVRNMKFHIFFCGVFSLISLGLIIEIHSAFIS